MQTNEVHRYEFEIKEQRRKHKSSNKKSIRKKFLFSLLCVFGAGLFELFFQFVQTLFDDIVNIHTALWDLAETLIFLFASEGISTLFSTIFPSVPSLSAALGGIWRLIMDRVHIFRRKANVYLNNCQHNIGKTENYSNGKAIDFVKSDSIKKYLSMRSQTDSPIFKASDIYPLAETGDRSSENTLVLKELSRLEELFNYRFGVIYQSKFNTMIVDPIASTHENNDKYFPYERIVPSAENGVVMVTKHNDKFILLKQYRHAPRKIQFSFPRGYGESGILSEENAKKELREEIDANISRSPILIGRLSPDSGLTSSSVYVYLVEVDDFSPCIGREGIIDIIECSSNEFEEMLYSNIKGEDDCFDDGFTIASYMLYTRYINRQEEI